MADRPGHDHDLDGDLHDGCLMCDTIRSRWPAELQARVAAQAHRRHLRDVAEQQLGRRLLEEG